MFAGAFLMRPLGGMLFGVLGDRFRCVRMPDGCDALGSHNPYLARWPPPTSRRSAVFVSLFMMALSTFSMGCLPTYDQVGITASMLLVFVRLVQGVSVGGQLVGTYVRLLLHHTIRATLTYATSLSPGTLFRLKAALRCEWVALHKLLVLCPCHCAHVYACWPGETWPRLGDLLGWCDCWHRARTRRQRLTACRDDVVRGACACSACRWSNLMCVRAQFPANRMGLAPAVLVRHVRRYRWPFRERVCG